ncbi:MAG: hypothetical protein HW405_839 [Candidatus Berkelbacteria bacterium]|nr:hypothetical protein [Candidatus Berkelbacteria bacterium]
MAQFTIGGRSTGMGASTTIVACSPTVKVRDFDRSGSGSHWSEAAEGPDDGIIVVKDVANSGRHNCYAQRLNGERMQVAVPDGQCVCDIWRDLGLGFGLVGA